MQSKYWMLSKAQRAKVEELALALYDERNPHPDRKIITSKAACIKRAKKKLFPRVLRKSK